MNKQRRTALVTGSSRGIGRQIAVELDSDGISVCINCREHTNEAEQTASLLSGDHGIFKADVSAPLQVREMFSQIKDRFGGVDILVNNAGVTRDSYLLFLKEDDWNRVVDVNMKGTYLCMKNAARHMMSKKWGRIINISSVAGHMGDVQRVNYAGSKAGIEGMSRSAARELAQYNITVNCVAPGLIQTEMAEDSQTGKSEKIQERIPIGRRGMPEEVARAVKFLASERAGYITGQALRVDGGLFMG